ncbi:MAG: hypothetical protein JOY95_01955 [Silvibacterium sp.]|nr:hypothetical protein [Silvibacterium sp.]
MILLNLIRLIGVALIVLGTLFWTRVDYTESLVRIHMQLGVTLVILLWILAIVAIRARVSGALVVRAILFGLIVAAYGMALRRLLGSTTAPNVYRVLHLLAGLGAIGLAESLGARIKRSVSSALV